MKFFKSVWGKRCVAIFIAFVVFIVSYLFSFNLFKESSVDVFAENIAVSTTDPECYYMFKAPSTIAFQIRNDSSENPYGYTLTDSDGNHIETTVKNKKDNKFVINPPLGGYQPGETYTLEIAGNTYFDDLDLEKARKLIFEIEREKIEHYKFTEQVVEVEETLDLNSNGMLIIPQSKSFNAGDVAFGKNSNGDYVAHKIVSVSGNLATVETPAADEIYEEILIYNDYALDVTEIEMNPELEERIVNNVLQSDFYSDLMYVAYEGETPAEHGEGNSIEPLGMATTGGVQTLGSNTISKDGFELTYEVDEEKNTITFEMSIELKAGEKGLFGIEALKNHSVTVNLSFSMGAQMFANMESLKEWNINATVTSDFSWSVDINIASEEYKDDPDLDDFFEKGKFSDQYHKVVKKISSKLERMSDESRGFEFTLFDCKFPVSAVPGLFFEAEFEGVIDFSVSADLTIGNSHNTMYMIGVRMADGELQHYANKAQEDSGLSMALKGTAQTRFGIQLEMGLCIIDDDVACLEVAPEVGFYFDIYAFAPITGMKDFKGEQKLYTYAETGIYMRATINVYVNFVLVDDIDEELVVLDKKWPLPKGGYGSSEIVLGMTIDNSVIYAEHNTVSLPDVVLEYYEITSATGCLKKSKLLSPDEYKVYDQDGHEIDCYGGKIDVPSYVDDKDMVLTVKYKHDNDKEYEAQITITRSNSIIEGQVSAFNRGNYRALSGAQVSLYEIDNPNETVITSTTGSNGKFKFHVIPGTYKVRISADGYKTLTTTQTIGANETKYTEHLLLLDESQDGLGKASGTISNALNGEGVANATIKLREEWNNTSGSYVEGFSTTTNSSGRYVVEGLPIGYYTIEVEARGYVKTTNNILVLDDGDLVDFDFAMTPVLEEGEVRIILNWGASPSDLDSHLVGKTPDGGAFNVYYSAKKYSYNGVEMANLDHDDTSSYGPETITILEDINGTYTYAVHDYSNRGSSSSTAMSYSGARVRVLVGGREHVEEFYVPVGRTGTYWTVFKIDSSYNIIPVNTVSNTKPSA